MRSQIVCADLFCGAGGTSTGLANAAKFLGLDLDLLAINHWDIAISTHSANHPTARHLCASIDAIQPIQHVPGGRLDLLVASPECFPSGTLVLTMEGYLPIERIRRGMEVLTHLNRWRPVTELMKCTRSTVIVKGQGHPGLEVSEEHPFYTRSRKHTHRPDETGNRFRFEDARWTPARDLKPGKQFWAAPESIPELPLPPVAGRGFEFTSDFWWLVGLWLAEGTVRLRDTSSEITLCCGKHEGDRIEKQLSVFVPRSIRAGMGELRWRRRDIRTATLFETAHQGLAAWLVQHFGKHASKKSLPAWVYGMSVAWRQALLAGYLSGDGHIERPGSSARQSCQTVSKALAYSVRTLAGTLGFRVSVHDRTPSKDTIEGRAVNIKPALGVYWTMEALRRDSFLDGTHHWQRIRSTEPGRDAVEVYNLSVEEDESYVAEGIVVHNCTHHSRARGGRPMSDQSRASAWLVLKWLQELYVENLLIENVREFEDWGPLSAEGKPLPSKRGHLFQAWVNAIKALGYSVDWKVLNAADYGDATTRERLFVIAKRGKRRITWPEPTHAKDAARQPGLFSIRKQWRPAREIIDWSLPGKSIFTRSKPLAPATLARIMAGLVKYKWPEPFIVLLRNHMDARSLNEPLPTITAGGQHVGICRPFVVPQFGEAQPKSADSPLGTITTTSRGIGLATAFVLGQQSCSAPRSVAQPMPTIATGGAISVIEPFVAELRNGKTVNPVSDPLSTVTTKGAHHAIVEGFVVPFFGERDGQQPRTHRLSEPLPTVTGHGAGALVEPFVMPVNHGASDTRSYDIDKPFPTVTSVDAWSMVEPLVVEYYGTADCRGTGEPLATVTARDRFGLLAPGPLQIDILFRMLQPHELAAAMGYEGYKFSGTREQKVKQIGNGVPERLARALCMEILRGKAGTSVTEACA